VVPTLEKLAKQGAEGQKKITEYTRYATIGLCIVQSIGIATILKQMDASNPDVTIIPNTGIVYYLICILTFTTGTAFIMWVGEQISENGVGNGISLIIFISIVAQMPHALFRMIEMIVDDEISIFHGGILIMLLVGVVAGVIWVTLGQRRIPVQYPRQVKGRRQLGGSRSYLPLRVNQVGVIPIIFASSLLMLPGMLGGALGGHVTAFFNTYFTADGIIYNLSFAALIIFFCYFYTAITFNPVDIADNMKKHGSVVMGVRPGRATSDYLEYVMNRITLVGAIFLAGVALVPSLVNVALDIRDWTIVSFFGGTSLLILVSVALDTVRQIEQHLVMRNYEGFMKAGRVRSGRRV
jgi:preprotein translocase subunit SecY